MRLLVKVGERSGLVAHIPNDTGHPLCTARLDPNTWYIQERRQRGITICNNCRREQAKHYNMSAGSYPSINGRSSAL